MADREKMSLNILRVMGCTSDQYASMERYLVRLTEACRRAGHRHYIIYEEPPQSSSFVKDIHTHGGEILTLKCQGPLDLSFYRQLNRILSHYDIDLIHTYFTPTCHFALFLALLKGIPQRYRTAANMPLSVEKPRSAWGGPSLLSQRTKHRLFASLPHKILCRSEGVADEYRYLGIRRNKLLIVDGGVDTSVYCPQKAKREQARRALELEDSCLAIGFAGRLVRVKGIPDLLEAASRMVAVHDHFRILIVGEGPCKDDWAKQAKERHLDSIVQFLGHRDDIPLLLNGFDLYVHPSSAEGMSNSILEAMATGLPVVANDIGANRGLIRHGETGCLVPDHDVGVLANVLLELLRDAKKRALLGQHARQTVSESFTIERRVELEMKLYSNHFPITLPAEGF